MKLKNQVCSMQQGKRLASLGVDPTLCYFVHYGCAETGYTVEPMNMVEDDGDGYVGYAAPAYTVAELGAMLPEWITHKGTEYRIEQWKASRTVFCIQYRLEPLDNGDMFTTMEPTEAQARAAMLIHLLESKLITPEQCATNLNH